MKQAPAPLSIDLIANDKNDERSLTPEWADWKLTFIRDQRGNSEFLTADDALTLLRALLDHVEIRVLVVDDARPDHPWFGHDIPGEVVQAINGKLLIHAHQGSLSVG